jgi:hypothetical protein
MSADWTRLKTPGLVGDDQLCEHIQNNVAAFLDWGFLGLGSHVDVYLNSQAPYGGNPSTLRLSDDVRYPKGLVWEGFRQNWVWEQGIDGPQAINISGIYVNGSFVPNNSSVFNIDYPRGRVVFNSPISSASTVQVEYSYKLYNFYPANVQWFVNLMQGSLRLDDLQFNQYGSGIWSVSPSNRAQLPAVVVEAVPTQYHRGKGLGGGTWYYPNVLFHVFATTPTQRNNAVDIISFQTEKRFFFFDQNAASRSGVYPLNQYGFLVNPSSNYPFLVNNFLDRAAIIYETTTQQLKNESQCIYTGLVRWSNFEVDYPEV